MRGEAILLVEDDPGVVQFVSATLSAQGYRPLHAGGIEEGWARLGANPEPQAPRLVVLDLGLPDGDGVALVSRLRADPRFAALPVLVLSARHDEDQKIAALDAGADDYLTKPFSAGELLARMRAMLRRAALVPAPARVLRVGALDIDLDRREVKRDGQPGRLTPIEYRLLACLASRPGHVVTHRQLLSTVWGAEQIDQLHYLRIYMGHLRAKLEDNPAEPRHLLTELGVGYRLADE